MNYSTIKYFDIANGEGVRTTLFVSGCRRGCPGCFNTEAWDFSAGKPFTREIEDEILESLSASYVDGLTLLGGEPMEPENQTGLLPFLQRVRSCFPEKTIWCYTGELYENLLDSRSRCSCKVTQEILSLIDIWWMAHLSEISMTLLSGLKERPIRELSILQKQERRGSFDFGKTIQLMQRIV